MDTRLFDWRFAYKLQEKEKAKETHTHTHTTAAAPAKDEEKGADVKEEAAGGEKKEKKEDADADDNKEDDDDENDEEEEDKDKNKPPNPILVAFRDSRLKLRDRGKSLPLPQILYGCVDPDAIALPTGVTITLDCGLAKERAYGHELVELTGPKTVGQVLKAVFCAICRKEVVEEGEEEEDEAANEKEKEEKFGKGLPGDCSICPQYAFAGIVRDGWSGGGTGARGGQKSPHYKVLWSNPSCSNLLRPEGRFLKGADTTPEEAVNMLG
jgi:hypothetical protein